VNVIGRRISDQDPHTSVRERTTVPAAAGRSESCVLPPAKRARLHSVDTARPVIRKDYRSDKKLLPSVIICEIVMVFNLISSYLFV